ncbi:MAG: D-tyrosyl-tRNA(Tyr) deacylase [Deltaproteobacteria bacterium]|nr:D-tyrosyl-tRNA(Tyr) deacylase [Deltaproteobacteria bacterium]
MRIALQRVRRANVCVGCETVAEIGTGLLLLAAFGPKDSPDSLEAGGRRTRMISKILNLRIFPDEKGVMNLSLVDHGGEVLVVSQFTLYADCRKGRRPSYSGSLPSPDAKLAYEAFVQEMGHSFGKVRMGVFGADMDLELCNWGPVTIVLDSEELESAR